MIITNCNTTTVNSDRAKTGYYNATVSKNFDETRRELVRGINRIAIESDINVLISACDTDYVIVHLHGFATMGREVKLSVLRIREEIQIAANLVDTEISSNVGLDNLTIDIKIPMKAFEAIYIEKQNANIELASFVNAKVITIDSRSGSIDISAIFQVLNVYCKRGEINVKSEICSDVMLNIVNEKGDINVFLGNAGISQLSVNFEKISYTSNPESKVFYTVSGYIISKNGNTKFY